MSDRLQSSFEKYSTLEFRRVIDYIKHKLPYTLKQLYEGYTELV